MPKKDFSSLPTDTKLDIVLANQQELKKAHVSEAQVERLIEHKLYEVKAVSYSTLIIVAILLALAIGAILKVTLG